MIDEKIVEDIISKLSDKKNTKNIIKSKDVNTYSMPSRGRKQCEQCKKYVGVRTSICKCGYVFPIKTEKKNDGQELSLITDEQRKYAQSIGAYGGGRFIYAGSGKCPSVLKDIDQISVEDFCEDIVSIGLNDSKIYLPSAIKSFIRHSYGSGEELEKVFLFVDEWYQKKIM